MFGILISAVPITAVVGLIWLHTVWHGWKYSGPKASNWLVFGGAYFFGVLISLVWASSDRKLRGLYNLIESWNIDRWVIVGVIVFASLIYAGSIRLFYGEEEEEHLEE